MKKLFPYTIAVTLIVLTAGCASSGYKKADATASYLESTAARINRGATQIDAATASLTELVEKSDADLKLQYKNFSSAVSGLESAARDIASRSIRIQQLGASYFQKWDEQLALIQNEEIRNDSAERKVAVMRQFDQVKASYDEARTAFNPLLADLRDLRTAIGTDLNQAGVTAISESVAKVNAHAATVRLSLVDLATQFKELGKSLEVPASSPAPKKTSAEKTEAAK